MKVLISVTKAELGGAQSFVANLAKGLRNRGESVFLAFGPEGNYLPDFCKENDLSFFKMDFLRRSASPLVNFKAFWKSLSFFKDDKFDLVHLNSSNTLFLALAIKLVSSKTKIVFTFHGLSFLDSNSKVSTTKRYLYWLFFKFFSFFIDKAVFVSKINLEYALKAKLVKNGIAIYNGIKLRKEDLFLREDAIERLGIESGFLIANIGRLAFPKNQAFLINIFSEIKKIKPSAKLIFIGTGPDSDNLKVLASKVDFSDDVIFLGEKREAWRFLKAFDLFVLPSFYEGLSLSLIEALKADIPAIASDVGGNCEVIGVENCFQLDNQKDFLSKFEKVCVYHKESSSRESFDFDSMLDKYLNLYKELCQK